MNSFTDQESFYLPEKLAENYEIRSCLKYSGPNATYLLEAKDSKRPYLLKVTADPLFAGLLANEKNILRFVQQLEPSSFSRKFPVSVYFGTSPFVAGLLDEDAQQEPYPEITLYLRTYIEGKTLEELCETNYRKPGLELSQALDYIIELTELLHFLHGLNPPLIHRDIKPQNVVVDSEGTCHFIDFGISRFYQTTKRGDTFIMGTKLTAPPEQFGYQQTDIRSDLYSLGILLFYCITGEYEVDERSLAELDPPLAHIIRKATMFDPDKRYQTTEELMPELLSARYPDILKNQLRLNKKRISLPSVLPVFFLIANLLLFTLLLYKNIGLSTTSQTDTISTESSDGSLPQASANDASSEYTFQEPLIEEAVRKQLNKTSGPITMQDLKKITELHIMGLQIYSDDSEFLLDGQAVWFRDDEGREAGLYSQKGPISSLEDILHMPNLDTLCLYRQQISDISLLKDTAIANLGLGYNPLTDLSPLEGNPSVTSLNLACLNISETDVLSTLPNLERLNISGTGITSLAGLENCKIEQLNLYGLSPKDHTELQNLPYLRDLTLNLLTPEILGCIEGLPITDLKFSNSSALKIDRLAVLPELETLSFRGNHFEPLLCEHPDLKNLSTLDLLDVTVKDFKNFASLNSLTLLHIYGASCESYDGLDQIPNLRMISCTEEQHEQIHAQYPDKDFIYLYP